MTRMEATPIAGCRMTQKLALVALGYRNLSMTASAIGAVKAMVLALDAGEASDFLLPRIAARDGAPSLRDELRAFAESKGVPL